MNILENKKISDQQFVELCQNGNTQGVVEAVNFGSNVNSRDGKFGTTALMMAAEYGHTEIVNVLIKAGVDVNDNANGTTPLMLASYHGYIEIINALIEAGADVNAKNYYGQTALIEATSAWDEHLETTDFLLKAGADINAKNKDGETALMMAAEYGHTEIIKAFIKAGAEDTTDNEGKTALFYAAEYGRPETLNALIDIGLDVKHKDNSGKMAVDYARDTPELRYTSALKRLEKLSK